MTAKCPQPSHATTGIDMFPLRTAVPRVMIRDSPCSSPASCRPKGLKKLRLGFDSTPSAQISGSRHLYSLSSDEPMCHTTSERPCPADLHVSNHVSILITQFRRTRYQRCCCSTWTARAGTRLSPGPRLRCQRNDDASGFRFGHNAC